MRTLRNDRKCRLRLGRGWAFLFVAVAWMTSSTAAANVAPMMYEPGSGGNLTPLDETDLRLADEKLSFEVRSTKEDEWIILSRADVRVEFTIENPGEEREVTLGFVASKGRDQTGERILDLEEMEGALNGEPVELEKTPLDEGRGEWLGEKMLSWPTYDVEEGGEEPFLRERVVFYFDATLEPGANKLTYTYETGSRHSREFGRHIDFTYILSTIRAWEGEQVEDFELRIRAGDARRMLYLPRQLDTDGSGSWSTEGAVAPCAPYGENWDPYFVEKDGATFTYRANDFTPERDLRFTYTSIPREKLPFPLDERDFDADPGDLYRKLTAEQLRILANTRYALRGYVFDTPELRKYFEDQCWYQPDEEVTSAEASRDIGEGELEHVELQQRMARNYESSTAWNDWWIQYGDGDFYAAADEGEGEVATFDDFLPAPEEGCQLEVRDREVTSVVGRYISFRYVTERDCGNGVVERVHWKTVKLPYDTADESPETVGFGEFSRRHFDKEQFRDALMEHSAGRRALESDGAYNCVDVEAAIESSPGFLFLRYEDGKARIRVGLTEPADADCEAPVVELDLELPPDDRIAEMLERAEQERTTWRHLMEQ